MAKLISMVLIISLMSDNVMPFYHVSNSSSYYSVKWNLHGRPGEGYYTEVLIGTPKQKLNILVDTGSSNFAIAAASNPSIKSYFHSHRSSTFAKMNVPINTQYTQGHWKGSLGSDLVILFNVSSASVRANIACIEESDHFFILNSNWQGILGLAYDEIAQPDSSVTPYFDSLVDSSNITNKFSLQLCGMASSEDNITGGVLAFGDFNNENDLYYGPVLYTPIVRERYYEVLLTSMGVGNVTLNVHCRDLNKDKTIVDSGTTNFRVSKYILDKIVQQLDKQVKLTREIPDGFWKESKMMCWHRKEDIPWNDFPSISLSLAQYNDSAFTLVISPQQYLRKVFEDVEVENKVDKNCYKFAIDKSHTGTVIGDVIMEGYYIIFDRRKKRIGFAQSTCAIDYLPDPPKITLPFYFKDPISQCKYNPSDNESGELMIVAYVLAAICGVCAIPMLIMLMLWIWRNIINRRRMRISESSSDFDYLVQ